MLPSKDLVNKGKEEDAKKTFLFWANSQLKTVDYKVTEIEDFHNGVPLFYLLQALYKSQGKDFPLIEKMDRRSNLEYVKKMNVKQILEWLEEKENMKFFGITATNIVNKDTKIIMALLWRLISVFFVSDEEEEEVNDGKKKVKKNPYKRMMKWMERLFQKRLHNDDQEDGKEKQIKKDDWKKGIPLLDLLRALFKPENDEEKKESDLFFEKVDKKIMEELFGEAVDEMLDFSEKKMSIPKLITKEQVFNLDEKSLTTYLIFFKNYEKVHYPKEKKKEVVKENKVDEEDERRKKEEVERKQKEEDLKRIKEKEELERKIKEKEELEKKKLLEEKKKREEEIKKREEVERNLKEKEEKIKKLEKERKERIEKERKDRESINRLSVKVNNYENQFTELQKKLKSEEEVEKLKKEIKEKDLKLMEATKSLEGVSNKERNLKKEIFEKENQIHKLQQLIDEKEKTENELLDKFEKEIQEERKLKEELNFSLKITQKEVKEFEEEKKKLMGQNTNLQGKLKELEKTEEKATETASLIQDDRKFDEVPEVENKKNILDSGRLKWMFFFNPIISGILGFLSIFSVLIPYLIAYRDDLNYAPPTFFVLEVSPFGEISVTILAFYFIFFTVTVLVRMIHSPLNIAISFANIVMGIMLPIGYIFTTIWKIQEGTTVLHEIGFWLTFLCLGFYYTTWVVEDYIRAYKKQVLYKFVFFRKSWFICLLFNRYCYFICFKNNTLHKV